MNDLKKAYDVIIVGAGTAGTIAARFCAKYGLNVCLIDRKSKNRIGDKICGDGAGLEIFDFLGINHPKDEEVLNRIKGFKMWAPNLKTCITVNNRNQTAYVIDRLKFGQRLLTEALDAGISTLLDDTLALDLIYKDKTISGVKIKTKGETSELNANIVIDASGVHSLLRRNIKSDLIEKELSEDDAVLCYREIIELQDTKTIDQDYVTIIKDLDKCHGGIIWYFPRGETSVNLGLGLEWRFCKDNKGALKDRYKKFVIDHFVKDAKYKVISSAGAVDSLRRPLWTCVENGIMFAGDAAFHVNPLNGGGIDPSMRAGYYAANAAKCAHEKEDFSINGLWKYNMDIMTTFGADFAALDLQKPFHAQLTNEEQDFMLEKGLITGDEFSEMVIHGTIKLSLNQMISKAFKGISKPSILLKFNWLRKELNKILKHYYNYPSNIDGLEPWKKETEQMFEKVKNKFNP